MKKLFAIILISTTLLSLVGCNLSKIEIGVRDGAIYFEHSNRVPEVNILVFEGQVQVRDPLFFEKLVSCIEWRENPSLQQVPSQYTEAPSRRYKNRKVVLEDNTCMCRNPDVLCR